MKIDIKSLNLQELTTQIIDLGLPKFRAGQIYSWLHKQCATSFDEMTNLSLDLRAKLDEQYEIKNCETSLSSFNTIPVFFYFCLFFHNKLSY